MAKEPNEKRIREKILKALKQKLDGSTATLRQAELNKIAGKTTVRAPYLEALLLKMREEGLIDCHWWQTDSTRFRSGVYWGLYGHPENVKHREWIAQRDKESEELRVRIAERERRQKIENAPRLAKEKFQKDLDQFIARNHNQIFDVIRRIYRDYTPKTRWLHSRQWL
jgi:hypothetical protein